MALENQLTNLITPHLTTDRGWCMTCKKHVGNRAKHIAEALIEAGVEINKPWFKERPNPLNFTCPTCFAVEGQACRPLTTMGKLFEPEEYHNNRGGD